MKNFYTFLIAILVSGLGFGQSTVTAGLLPTGGPVSSQFNTTGDWFKVSEFTITDGTGDVLPTIVANVNLKSYGGANEANWSNTIGAVRIKRGVTVLTTTQPQINAASIDIGFDISPPTYGLSIPQGESQTFTIEIYLSPTIGALVDNSTLSFFIDDDDSGFSTAGAPGVISSSFANPLAGDIVSPPFIIDVDRTELRFLGTIPNATVNNVAPQVQVAGTDANGNIDVDLNLVNGLPSLNNVALFVGNSSFSSASISEVTLQNGIATFNNLYYLTAGSDVNLGAFVPLDGGQFGFAFSNNFVVNATSQGQDYTFTNGSWSPDPPNDPTNPITGNDNLIIATGDAVIDYDITTLSVTVNPGASLTIDAGATLTVLDNMTLESTSTRYASFIFNGVDIDVTIGSVVGGLINYKRFVNANSNGNDLISSPVGSIFPNTTGISWQEFKNTGSNATDLLSVVDDNDPNLTLYAFAPFVKGSTDDFVNYTSDTDEFTTRLLGGQGFRVATVADEDSNPGNGIGRTLTFSGDLRTGTVAPGVSFDPGAFADWNLIGNPYPSYISIEEFFTSTAGNPTPNIDKLTNNSGIYGYDGDVSDGWDVITLANVDTDNGGTDRLIAPGQGFFFPATNGGASGTVSNSVYFDKTMRRTGSSDDFIVGRNTSALTFLKLNASTANKTYKTQFYFNENASLGGDHGYDGRVLGTPPNFALYSHLVQDNTGLPMALQALNPSDLVETTVIPLGVNSNQGEQITFTILESSLPDTIEVYLEDTVTNTFTLLNSGDYTLTPTVALNGTGRFYLRFGEGALSTTETTLADLNIYTNQNDKTIVVAGQLLEPTTASVYDIQGRLVNTTPLVTTSRSQSIDVSNLSSGVYVVQLNNGTQNKTQKVILR